MKTRTKAASAWGCAMAALALTAGTARADDNFLMLPGCGSLYTYNSTNYWVWVTMYDTAKVTHMDWGWMAPHSSRRWTGGGSPPPFNTYYCGFYYYARGEVKATGPQNTPNIFDTTVRMSPKNKPGKPTAWDVGACIKTGDGKSFYWDYSDSCIGDGRDIVNTSVDPKLAPTKPQPQGAAAKPAPVSDVKPASLKPTPHPQPSNVKLAESLNAQAPYGPSSAVRRIGMSVDGDAHSPALGNMGTWSTTTPAVIQLVDAAGGFRVLKSGTGTVVWNYQGKTYQSTVNAR